MAPDRPFAPTWLVMILAALALLMLTAHVLLLSRSTMPSSRKRIRLANGILMMCTCPIAAYALGVVTPANARAFAFAWVLVTGLVVVVIFLALLDMFNTWRLGLREGTDISRDVLAKISPDSQTASHHPDRAPPAA